MKILTLHEVGGEARTFETLSKRMGDVIDAAMELMGRFGEKYKNHSVLTNFVFTTLADPNADILLAVEDDGSIVGMLSIAFIPNAEGSRALLDNLAVAEKYEDNGVATAIIAYAKVMSRRRHMRMVCVPIDRDASARVRKLYATAGFELDASEGHHVYL